MALQPLTKHQFSGALLIAAVITLLAIGSEYSGLDLYLATQFYDPVSGSWPYRTLYLTSTLLHTGGRLFVVLLAAINLVLWLASFLISSLAPYRKALLFVLVAGVIGPAIVSLLKDMTHIYTPWKLTLFGSDMPYIRIFDKVPAGSPVGHAFPGGHASGGFAWFSLYFLTLAANSRYRLYALLLPLLLGGVFALTQEIRGAHFLSHDLFAFVICWCAALFWSRVFFARRAIDCR